MKKHHILFNALLLLGVTSYAQRGTQVSQLLFKFDQAGNQIQREYCESNCHLKKKEAAEEAINTESNTPIARLFDESVIMYPNPTTGILNLKWDSDLRGVVHKIQLFNYQGRLLRELAVADLQNTQLNLTTYPTGAYLAKFVFTDASIHTRQIIKN